MNTVGYAQGGSGQPHGWLSKVEEYVNRAADALIEGFESLAKDADRWAKSIAQRFSRKRSRPRS